MGTLLGGLWLYDRWATGVARVVTGWGILALILFSGCCLVSRRLHDLGRAGWWTAGYLALFLIAWPHPRTVFGVLMAALALELALRPGQARFNRFGPPLA